MPTWKAIVLIFLKHPAANVRLRHRDGPARRVFKSFHGLAPFSHQPSSFFMVRIWLSVHIPHVPELQSTSFSLGREDGMRSSALGMK
jgi:hypothetical protein